LIIQLIKILWTNMLTREGRGNGGWGLRPSSGCLPGGGPGIGYSAAYFKEKDYRRRKKKKKKKTNKTNTSGKAAPVHLSRGDDKRET